MAVIVKTWNISSKTKLVYMSVPWSKECKIISKWLDKYVEAYNCHYQELELSKINNKIVPLFEIIYNGEVIDSLQSSNEEDFKKFIKKYTKYGCLPIKIFS